MECVATGNRHDARDVCFVAVVDNREKVLLKKKVKPEKRVVSYLTPLTGVREGDLDDGEKLSDVISEVKRLLGPDVVLVGQSVKSDIKWLQLQEGRDYARTVDLAHVFRAYNPRYGSYTMFPLSHEANTLLYAGIRLQSGSPPLIFFFCMQLINEFIYSTGCISDQHDPASDAIAAMKLFNKYHGKPELLEQAKQKLLSTRVPLSFAKRNNYRWEGVCMAAFVPNKCFCGAPTLKT